MESSMGFDGRLGSCSSLAFSFAMFGCSSFECNGDAEGCGAPLLSGDALDSRSGAGSGACEDRYCVFDFDGSVQDRTEDALRRL